MYQTGDSVKIKWGTQWYPGSVLGVCADHIRVIYKQDSTFDVIKRAQVESRLRLIQAGAFEGFKVKQMTRVSRPPSRPYRDNTKLGKAEEEDRLLRPLNTTAQGSANVADAGTAVTDAPPVRPPRARTPATPIINPDASAETDDAVSAPAAPPSPIATSPASMSPSFTKRAASPTIIDNVIITATTAAALVAEAAVRLRETKQIEKAPASHHTNHVNSTSTSTSTSTSNRNESSDNSSARGNAAPVCAEADALQQNDPDYRRVGDRVNVVYGGVKYPAVVVEETSPQTFNVKYEDDPVLGKNLTVSEHGLVLVERRGRDGGCDDAARGSKRRKVDQTVVSADAPTASNSARVSAAAAAAAAATAAAPSRLEDDAQKQQKVQPKVSSHYYDSWSLGVTKDGEREFFFNRATGAVRWAGANAVGPMEGRVINYGNNGLVADGGGGGSTKKSLYKIACGMNAGSKVASIDANELHTFLEMQKQPVLTKEAASRILGRQKVLEAKLLQAQQHAYHYKYILYQKQQKEEQRNQTIAAQQQKQLVRNPPSSCNSPVAAPLGAGPQTAILVD